MRERAAVIHALRHWRPYLVAREFLLRTDHRPNLKLAQGGGNVYDTLTDEIQQFQPFTMEYLPGKKMFVYALSGKPPPTSVNTVTDNPLPKFPSDQDLAKIQQQDPILGPALALHKKLPIKSNPEAEALTNITLVHNGVLCRQSISGLQALVPVRLRQLLIYLAHDMAGHYSAEYVTNKLSGWFWPKMSTDIINYCTSCDICSQTKAARPETCMPLQEFPPALRLGDRLHIDLLSMPRSASGKVGICTAVDAATGFIFATAIENKTSQGVINILCDLIIPYFGCPKVLVTDLGTENINSEVKTLCSRFNINHITASVGHAQGNGMVERRQNMIISFLRKSTGNIADQNNWDHKLNTLASVLNSTTSASRHQSPYFLTFLQHPRFPYN